MDIAATIADKLMEHAAERRRVARRFGLVQGSCLHRDADIYESAALVAASYAEDYTPSVAKSQRLARKCHVGAVK